MHLKVTKSAILCSETPGNSLKQRRADKGEVTEELKTGYSPLRLIKSYYPKLEGS